MNGLIPSSRFRPCGVGWRQRVLKASKKESYLCFQSVAQFCVRVAYGCRFKILVLLVRFPESRDSRPARTWNTLSEGCSVRLSRQLSMRSRFAPLNAEQVNQACRLASRYRARRSEHWV